MKEKIIEMSIGSGVYEKESQTIEKLKGKLHGIVVQTEGTTSINITSSLGYKIFSGKCNGTTYFPIREYVYNHEGTQQSKGSVPRGYFMLDEEVIIVVEGSGNQEVKVIFRLE